MDADLRFDGRVVVVTGGGAGLGAAYCLDLAARGAQVVVLDIDGVAATAVCDEIEARGGRALAVEVAPDGGAGTASAVLDVISGLGRLDGLVNNAGIAHTALLGDDHPDDLERLLDVHLRTPYHAVRAAWPELVRARGRIVNIVSNAALFGKADMASYAASKGALLAWTRSIALEAAPLGILVNAVAPIAATRLTEGMLGDLHDPLAADRATPAVVWLLHPSCREQGQVISIAGGSIARVVNTRHPSGVALSAEQVRDLLAATSPAGSPAVPVSAADEVQYVRAELSDAGVVASPTPPNRSS